MQHAALSPERWARFSFGQQILMIANELNRGRRLAESGQGRDLALSYERVLNLVDLSVGLGPGRGRRRELLRAREILGELYLAAPDPGAHVRFMRCLLALAPESYPQIEALFGA